MEGFNVNKLNNMLSTLRELIPVDSTDDSLYYNMTIIPRNSKASNDGDGTTSATTEQLTFSKSIIPPGTYVLNNYLFSNCYNHCRSASTVLHDAKFRAWGRPETIFTSVVINNGSVIQYLTESGTAVNVAEINTSTKRIWPIDPSLLGIYFDAPLDLNIHSTSDVADVLFSTDSNGPSGPEMAPDPNSPANYCDGTLFRKVEFPKPGDIIQIDYYSTNLDNQSSSVIDSISREVSRYTVLEADPLHGSLRVIPNFFASSGGSIPSSVFQAVLYDNTWDFNCPQNQQELSSLSWLPSILSSCQYGQAGNLNTWAPLRSMTVTGHRWSVEEPAESHLTYNFQEGTAYQSYTLYTPQSGNTRTGLVVPLTMEDLTNYSYRDASLVDLLADLNISVNIDSFEFPGDICFPCNKIAIDSAQSIIDYADDASVWTSFYTIPVMSLCPYWFEWANQMWQWQYANNAHQTTIIHHIDQPRLFGNKKIQKGTLIQLENGPVATILNMNGYMADVLLPYMSSNQQFTAGSSFGYLLDLDPTLEEFYNNLSTNIQYAIVPKQVGCFTWYYSSSSNILQSDSHNINGSYWYDLTWWNIRGNLTYCQPQGYQEGPDSLTAIRHIYLPTIHDLLAYLGYSRFNMPMSSEEQATARSKIAQLVADGPNGYYMALRDYEVSVSDLICIDSNGQLDVGQSDLYWRPMCRIDLSSCNWTVIE